MKIAYFDCFSGVSGDMILGAFIDLGLPLEALKKELKKLPVQTYQISTEKVKKKELAATSVKIRTKEKRVVRTWSNIQSIIKKSSLDSSVKEKSQEILDKLAQAESYLHKTPLEKIHFHELGALDTLIDAVGAAISIKHLRIEKVYSSPLATGLGMVKTEHGALPIPTPATLEILKDVPIYSQNILAELTTPTGAAIIKTIASEFGSFPPMKVEKIGYGAGDKDLDIPNILRVVVGKGESSEEADKDGVTLLETNIDNTNAEFLGYLQEKLLAGGALDVWTTPIYMKKSRPAVSLSVLTIPFSEAELIETLFKETNTLGIRISKRKRVVLERKKIKVKTEFGEVPVKIGYFKNEAVSFLPEYEECAKLAKKLKIPIKRVYEAAQKLAQQKLSKE